jgi:hypothetical protein
MKYPLRGRSTFSNLVRVCVYLPVWQIPRHNFEKADGRNIPKTKKASVKMLENISQETYFFSRSQRVCPSLQGE